MTNFKEELLKIWQTKEFQLMVDICRILLVILLFCILFVLIKEIRAVKLLAYDPCAFCMHKTGALCTCFYADSNVERDAEGREIRIIEKKVPVYPEINYSLVNETFIKQENQE